MVAGELYGRDHFGSSGGHNTVVCVCVSEIIPVVVVVMVVVMVEVVMVLRVVVVSVVVMVW